LQRERQSNPAERLLPPTEPSKFLPLPTVRFAIKIDTFLKQSLWLSRKTQLARTMGRELEVQLR
jgi:hypothetical protein